jgi:dipeptidyl aminopeptidase/acylaminoacyl peptidase
LYNLPVNGIQEAFPREAQVKTQHADAANEVPISRYLNTRYAYCPSISSDGRRVAFVTDITGVAQAWQVRCDPEVQDPGWPHQLTFQADRVMGLWCSPAPGDDRLIYTRDVGGNENAQIYLYSPGEGAHLSLTTGHEDAMHIFGEWSPDASRILFAANRRNPGLFDLYLQPIDGVARLVWENPEPGFLTNLCFSPSGDRAAATLMSSSFCHHLFEIDLESGSARRISLAEQDTRYDAVCFDPGGLSLYLNTDLDSDFLRIVRLDLDGMAIQPVVSQAVDVELMTCSPDGRTLAYTANLDGTSELCLLDLASGETRVAPGLGEAPGVVGAMDWRLAFSPDSGSLAFSFTNAVRTSDIHIWDLASNLVWPVTRSAHGGVPLDSFVAPALVHYPTFDTTDDSNPRQIPAWFFQPRSHAGAPVPAILLVHGGPEGQTRPYFHPLIQYFLQRGYAVFAPNVRGSTGYGKAYSHLDDVEKRMDSVADLAHAARWLQEQPGVDGDRLVVYGGSYGGFMVLSALCTYPDLWAAGVDIVGISSFTTFLENTSDYRRAHREAEYGSLDTDREFLESISPINHVDKITAPLIVIHGANDPRVPLSEAEQLVAALTARGISTEFIVFDDEGHGIAKLKNKLVAYPAIAGFLDRVLQRE